MDGLSLVAALRIINGAIRDKTYQELPLGAEVAEFLRIKRKRLTPASERAYEGALAQMAMYFPTLQLADLELPAGAPLLEQFLDDTWGTAAPRTYNKNLTFLREFFRFQVRRGRMRGNPCDPIERAKTREVYRTTFTEDESEAIIASASSRRDQIALRLLLYYALRQGALRGVQFKHFDFQRRGLTIFTKGGKVRRIPIPDPDFWMDLDRLILDQGSDPHHYLMPTAVGNQHWRQEDPTKPMSNRAAHYWWYARLADAGIVARGTTSGEKMHKARHTAGQRLLDAEPGNIKSVQKLLGHASIATTADIYVDWDDEQLAESLRKTIRARKSESPRE